MEEMHEEDVMLDEDEMPESVNREVASVVEDKKDYMPHGFSVNQTEVKLCKRQNHDSNAIISRLHIKLEEKSQLKISLY